jgi:hypothetical protein
MPRVHGIVMMSLIAGSACTDRQPLEPQLPPDPIVWQTFPEIPAGARAFEHSETTKGQIWRVVLQQDGVVSVQAVARDRLSRRDSIVEYRGFYSEQDEGIAFRWQLGDATATLRGDTLAILPLDYWEWPLNIPLRYLRTPRSNTSGFPPAISAGRIFVESSPVYRNQGMGLDSRYVLYDDGTFALQFSGLFEYRGTYQELDGRINFDWQGWSAAGPWGASGSLHGDTLDVKYNLVMQMTDFVDGVYIRQR